MSQGSTVATSGYDEERTIDFEELIVDAQNKDLSDIEDLSSTDIADVWWRVSQMVAQNLVNGKGTRVPELGLFTLSHRKGTTGGASSSSAPAFVLSPAFAARNEIRTVNRFLEGNIPVTSLGLARLAAATGLDKVQIEACIKEVVKVLEERVQPEYSQGIALEFPGIGRLSIRRGKVRFRFYSNFEEQPQVLQGRPPKGWTLSSRPYTAGEAINRPPTAADVATLPRLATPLLLPSPSFTKRHGPAQGSVGTQRISWQAQLNSNGYLGIIDPMNEPATVVRDGTNTSQLRSGAAKPPELPPLAEDEQREILNARVRNLEVTAKADTDSCDGPGRIAASTTTLIRHKHTNAPRPEDMPSRHRRDRKDAFATQTIGALSAARPATSGARPLREETQLFDPHRVRTRRGPATTCSRCQGNGVCYVCFQLRQPLPDPGYHRRVVDEEKALDRRLTQLAQKREDKARSIQKLLDDAKQDASRMTATLNYTAHVNKPPSEFDPAVYDTEPKMDVMHHRPQTSHGDIRRQRMGNAAAVASQINAARTQRRIEQAQQRAVEVAVLEATQRDNERLAAAREARFRHGQAAYHRELDMQAAERRAALDAGAAHDDALAVASQPFKQAVPDEDYVAKQRAQKRNDTMHNIMQEQQRQEYAISQRAAQLSEGQRLLQRAKADYMDELAHAAAESHVIHSELNRDLKTLSDAKRVRDAKSAQYRKSGAKLTLLEQTDYIERMRHVEPPPAGAVSFVGKSSNLQGGQFMKGTRVLA
eukprot:m.42799 g.42799  ORF g.42799 m.42799 type:complete len:762 (-) comp15037_c0_seq1:98-2383(-)